LFCFFLSGRVLRHARTTHATWTAGPRPRPSGVQIPSPPFTLSCLFFAAEGGFVCDSRHPPPTAGTTSPAPMATTQPHRRTAVSFPIIFSCPCFS
jgi:hypothetical protein